MFTKFVSCRFLHRCIRPDSILKRQPGLLLSRLDFDYEAVLKIAVSG